MSQEPRNLEGQTTRMERLPRGVWRLFRYLPPRMAYTIGLGPLVGRFVLLLKTVGRKSGKSRVTPLLYDQVNETIFVAPARGTHADWYQNLVANPNVEVTIGSRQFKGWAVPITNQVESTDFLEQRIRLHPQITRAAFRMEGLGPSPTRRKLEEYAKKRGLVAIHLLED